MSNAVDPGLLRKILGHYPTGVVAVTTIDHAGRAVAMIVGSFTSVSLDPALVAFLPRIESASFAQLRDAARFAVNILAHDQEALCRRLARSDPDKMDLEHWTASESGLPVLDDVVAVIECERRSVTEAGDHYLVIAEVTGLRTVRPTVPLLFFRGGYGGFAPSSIVMRADGGDLSEAVLEAQVVRGELERAAERLGGELTVFARIGQESVAVASASATGAAQVTELGARYPLVPPLGVPLVAWSSAHDQEAWIDRALGASGEERDRLRRHLSDARDAGWSLSLHESDELDAPVLGAAGESIEERDRRDVLRHRIMRAARYFDVAELVDERAYEVGAVMAPLAADGASPHLMVRLLLFPRARLSGAEIVARAREVTDFARLASRELEHAGSVDR